MAVVVFPNVWTFTVQDVMTPRPIVIGENEDLGLATALQKFGHFRHLPVVRDGDVVGVLSERDMLRALAAPGADRAARVCDVMTRKPATIAPNSSLRQAVGLMLRKKLGCLPVVDRGELVGIVTEADFVRFAGRVAGAVERTTRSASPSSAKTTRRPATRR